MNLFYTTGVKLLHDLPSIYLNGKFSVTCAKFIASKRHQKKGFPQVFLVRFRCGTLWHYQCVSGKIFAHQKWLGFGHHLDFRWSEFNWLPTWREIEVEFSENLFDERGSLNLRVPLRALELYPFMVHRLRVVSTNHSGPVPGVALFQCSYSRCCCSRQPYYLNVLSQILRYHPKPSQTINYPLSLHPLAT